MREDDIAYALEATQVLREPDRLIETFGDTSFGFDLISEDMDQVGRVRIRSGQVEAGKPLLIKPQGMQNVELEGFDEKVLKVIEHLRSQGQSLSFLQYGFQFKRGEVSQELVHDSLENVKARVLDRAREDDDPSHAVIEGVDDAWEFSIMKFTIDLISKSQKINQFDFKRRGLL